MLSALLSGGFAAHFPQVQRFLDAFPPAAPLSFLDAHAAALFSRARAPAEVQRLMELFACAENPLYAFIGLVMAALAQLSGTDLSGMRDDLGCAYLSSRAEALDLPLMLHNVARFIEYVGEGLR